MAGIDIKKTMPVDDEITWLEKRLAALKGSEKIGSGGGAVELPVQPKPVYETMGASQNEPVTDGEMPDAQETLSEVQQGSTGSFDHSDTLDYYKQQVDAMENNKPGAYSSAYTDQLQAMYDSIINRQGFTYDINADPFYQMYADKYTVNGQRAMQDAMAQASALTGGYGNSFGQMVGQQAYGEYMRGLTDKAIDLEGRAYGRYQDEGNDMLARYKMMLDAENQDYGRYQDALDRYWQEKQYAQGLYDDQWAREYGVYTDDRNYETQKDQIMYEREQQARDNAYATAMQILQTGQMPSAALLAAAGISPEDAQLLANAYKPKSSGNNPPPKKEDKDAKYWQNKYWQEKTKDVMDRTEWENTREKVDPFYAAQKNAASNNPLLMNKQIPQSTSEYNRYLESALENAVRNGSMSASTARQLAYQYAAEENGKSPLQKRKNK